MDSPTEHEGKVNSSRFGSWLRRARLRAGLTQQELAERAGLSTNAISALERGDRRHPYPATVRAIAAALGLSASEQVAMAATLSTSATSSDETAVCASLTTPLSSLIGRDEEVMSLRDLLSRPDVRLVTLTGSGGIGKSRLALAAARVSAPDFADGALFVALAPVRDPALVLPAIARVLGIQESKQDPLIDQVILALQPRHLLLVIDNMEQVIDAAPLLAELLAACPHLTILATRRRVLRLSGERDVPVPALEVPRAGDKLALDALGLVPSVHLFVERARGLVPDFELSGSNAGTIAAICRRLQGVPLAIELAAARSNLLSPAQLLTRLEQPLNLLTVAARDTPARHHTMRDVIAWSYDLLSAEDRALFRRLSVLVGSFSLEAAETIGAAGGEPVPDVLAGLGTLVDASLIKRIEARSGARMEMLQIVREYGLERLVESGEEVAVRRPHASYVLDQARQADQGWTGEEGGVWLARLSNDLDNTRAALDWLWSSDQYASGLELGSAMFRFWERTFLWREGRDWLERFLEHEETASPDVRMNALHGAGWLTLRLGDFDRARALAHESLAVGREHGLGLGPEALFFLLAGAVADERGDHHTAEAHFKDMLRTTRELGLTCATCAALSNLGTNAERVGDFASARTWYQQAVAFQREHHLWLPFDAVLPSLALVHMQLGERNEAARCLTEYLELICHLDVDPAGDVLVFLAIAFEQWLLAAQLIGFAIEHAAAQQRDPFWVTADSDTVDRELLRVKDQLGDSEFAVAVEKGRRLTRQQVIETARLLVHDTHLEQLDTEPDFRPSF